MNPEQYIQLAAAGVRELQPYQPGKPVSELERELGIKDIIKLASNENALGPSPKAIDAMRSELPGLARYPDGNGFTLKQALANKLGVAIEQLILGNGSNDVLEVLFRTFITPQDEVVFSEHAFAVYPITTQAVGAVAKVAAAKNWGHDPVAMRDAVTERTRLVLIANPNNPTGTWLGASDLRDLISAMPEHVLVVVDEAYFEVASDKGMGADDYPDAAAWINEFPNLIVTRTFSKVYGLAGLRVGYGISNPTVIDLMNRVRQPFNVNSLALAAAEAALQDSAHFAASLALLRSGMQQLTSAFDTMGLEYIPSVGNFVCVNVGRPCGEVYTALLRQGVIVRPVANYGMPEYLRITIGLEQENARFLESLSKVLKIKT